MTVSERIRSRAHEFAWRADEQLFFYQREEGVFEYPHLGRFVYGAYIKLKPFPTPTTRFGCVVGILEKGFKPKTGIIRPV